jgi:hypothetical protein
MGLQDGAQHLSARRRIARRGGLVDSLLGRLAHGVHSQVSHSSAATGRPPRASSEVDPRCPRVGDELGVVMQWSSGGSAATAGQPRPGSPVAFSPGALRADDRADRPAILSPLRRQAPNSATVPGPARCRGTDRRRRRPAGHVRDFAPSHQTDAPGESADYGRSPARGLASDSTTTRPRWPVRPVALRPADAATNASLAGRSWRRGRRPHVSPNNPPGPGFRTIQRHSPSSTGIGTAASSARKRHPARTTSPRLPWSPNGPPDFHRDGLK